MEVCEEMLDEVINGAWKKLDTKELRHLDLSGDRFCLESIQGLMHPDLRVHCIRVLSVGGNHIPDLSVLNHRKAQGENRFRELQTIRAPKNVMTHAYFDIDSLTAINLSGNRLRTLPDFGTACTKIKKLVLSKNVIDDRMVKLAQFKCLVLLDVSQNCISWKPSDFKAEIQHLSAIRIEEIALWGNPFGKWFDKYQFLTVVMLDTLVRIDGLKVSSELRSDMRLQYDDFLLRGLVDYSRFDIEVQEMKTKNEPIPSYGGAETTKYIPPVGELYSSMMKELDKALDEPSNWSPPMQHFHLLVETLFNMPWSRRAGFLGQRRGGQTASRNTDQKAGTGKATREQQESQVRTKALIDKIQTLMTRNDSCRIDTLRSVTRLVACGHDEMAAACALFLAEWVEESANDFATKIDSVSAQLFDELRERVAMGIVSVKEDGVACYEMQRRGADQDEHAFGNNDLVAECASILNALSQFGGRFLWQGNVSPHSARFLRPFLEVIIRPPSRVTGAEQPQSDEWIVYEDFDAMPGETVAEEIHNATNTFREEKVVVARGYGGFVLDQTKHPSVIKYKNHSPKFLTAMRFPCEGKSLYVRPSSASKLVESEAGCRVFDNYSAGLAVVAVATCDSDNAALCINKFELHKVSLFDDTEASNKQWLTNNTSTAAMRTVIRLLQIKVNLLQAAGEAKNVAYDTFLKHNLHEAIWQAVRTQLTDNGVAVELSVLKDFHLDCKCFLAWCLAMICGMGAQNAGCKDKLVEYLKSNAEFVYRQLLGIVSDTSTPEPLLFATSLQVIHLFLENDTLRPLFVQETLESLHHSASLLPFILGPELDGGAENVRFISIYRECELHYSQIYNSGQEVQVPPIREITNQMMHRVILNIVKLIELFSAKQDRDMSNVADILNRRQREKLLLGPTTGLINCPDWDTKLQSLKCVERVVQAAPDALSDEEMSWLMRYLQPRGIGVGQQEGVLTQVLELCVQLVEDETSAGERFRSNFGKQAIRVSYEMLLVNSKRDVSSSKEEEVSKVALSLTLCNLLQSCSRANLSGNLRKYLREETFTKTLNDVIIVEDGHDRASCRRALLHTWTGRAMEDVLLPLACGNIISLRGKSRQWTLERIGDVIWGMVDEEELATNVSASAEIALWPSMARIEHQRRHMDSEENIDWLAQQEAFVSSDGVNVLLETMCKVLHNMQTESSHYEACMGRVQQILAISEQFVHDNYKTEQHGESGELEEGSGPHSLGVGVPAVDPHAAHAGGGAHAGDGAEADTKVSSQKSEVDGNSKKIRTHFVHRLERVNITIMFRHGMSLSVFDPLTGMRSLEKLAAVFQHHFEDLQAMSAKCQAMDPSGWERLLSSDPEDGLPDQYFTDGSLKTLEECYASGSRPKQPRQPIPDLAALMAACQSAHKKLKKDFIVKDIDKAKDTEKAVAWSDGVFAPARGVPANQKVSKCLAEWAQNNGGEVYDPGLKEREVILRKAEYKYGNDFTRVRDISRLMVIFKTATSLCTGVDELKRSTKFTVVKIKNRYRRPTGTAERRLIVIVEIQTLDGISVLCELQLVVDPPGHCLEVKRQEFVRKLRESIAVDCGVVEDAVGVAELVLYSINTRAIRHNDLVSLMFRDSMAVEVSDEMVILPGERSHSDAQLFVIERQEGAGIVKLGEAVYLKSFYTDKYVGASLAGHIRCSCAEQGTNESNLLWVIEAPDEDEDDSSDAHLLSNITGMLFQSDAGRSASQAGKSSRKGMMVGVPLQSDIHVILVPQGTRRTLAFKDSLVGEDQQLHAVTSALTRDHSHHLLFTRHGSFKEYLSDTTFSYLKARASGIIQDEEDLTCKEATAKAHLREAFMHDEPGLVRVDLLSRAVGFKVLGEQQTNAKRLAPDSSPCFPLTCRMASVLKALYGLLVHAADYDATAALLDDVIGDPKRGASANSMTVIASLLACCLCSMTSHVEAVVRPGPFRLADVDLVSAWLPTKLLRVFNGVLVQMPADSQPATHKEAEGRTEVRKLNELGRTGTTDASRMVFVGIIVHFVRQVIVGPLMERLAVISHQPLTVREIALLRELAVFFGHVTRRFGCIELRNAASGQHKSAEEAEDAPSNMAAAFHMSFSGDSATWALGEDQRAEIFMGLIGRDVFHVLIRSFMYGIHRESMNYNVPDPDGHESLTVEREHLKLVVSLANHSTHTLAIMMASCGRSEQSPIDYDVCEAISQALADGLQLLPRFRIEELMRERMLATYGRAAQEYITSQRVCDNIVDQMTQKARGRIQSERVMFCALVWTAWAPDQTLPTLTRRLLVVTSRLSVVFLDMPLEYKDFEELRPSNFVLTRAACNINRIERTMVCPKIRQLLIFRWDFKDELTATNREIVIFLSSAHRNAFRDIMRIGQPFLKPRAKGPDGKLCARPKNVGRYDRGMFEAPWRKEAIYLIQYSLKHSHPRLQAKLVNLSFCVKEPGVLELLVLSNDLIGAFDAREFFKSCLSLEEDQEYYTPYFYETMEHMPTQDSESEGEGLSRRMLSVPQPADEVDDTVDPSRPNDPGPWPLDTLKGVWFVASNIAASNQGPLGATPAPQVKLQFGAKPPLTFTFLSDSDRQRFREKLAAAVHLASKPMSFVPTEAEEMRDVNKVLKAMSKHDDLRLKEVTKLMDVLRKKGDRSGLVDTPVPVDAAKEADAAK